MNVAEIVRGERDSTGEPVIEVYYKNPPKYAVYRTKDRVMIHFADESTGKRDEQRAALVQVSPLRGQINGLTDDWRNEVDASDSPSANALAVARFDRRVADALALALEKDLANASLYLESVKRDIDEERASRARRYYITAASAMAGGLLVLVALLLLIKAPSAFGFGSNYLKDVRSILIAGAAGSLGAFFSVALAIRDRSPLNDLRLWDNSVDAVLRIIIGFIGGIVLLCLFRTGVVTSIAFGTNPDESRLTPHGDDYQWMLVAVIGFVAGFVERLVGDLLAKSVLVRDASDTRHPPVPPGPPDTGSQPGPDVGEGTDDRPDGSGEESAQDGCDAVFDPADATADEDLPPTMGGVEATGAAPTPDAYADDQGADAGEKDAQ